MGWETALEHQGVELPLAASITVEAVGIVAMIAYTSFRVTRRGCSETDRLSDMRGS